MGEPRQSNNVRRIDFAKGGAKPPPLRGGDARAERPISDELSKVVPLPSPQGRRRVRRTVNGAFTTVIALLSALFGVLTAAALLERTF